MQIALQMLLIIGCIMFNGPNYNNFPILKSKIGLSLIKIIKKLLLERSNSIKIWHLLL